MAYTTGDALYQMQADVLWEDLSNNSLLSHSSLPSRDKDLHTTNKRVIRAINELLGKADTATDLTNEFKNRFNEIIGNEVSDPTLLTRLHEIDTNFFNAIFKIWERLGSTDLSISNIHTEVNTAIENLKKEFSGITELPYVEQYEYTVSEIIEQSFMLEHIPRLLSTTNFYINGILYPKSCFNISDKQVTWLFTEDNDGFDLDLNEMTVIIKYDYYEESDN